MIGSETGAFEARYLELLKRPYAFGDHRSAQRGALSHKIGGFIEAGLLLEVSTAERLQELTEEAHFRVFGEALAERRVLSKLGHPSQQDWSIYDAPPSQRSRQRRDPFFFCSLFW